MARKPNITAEDIRKFADNLADTAIDADNISDDIRKMLGSNLAVSMEDVSSILRASRALADLAAALVTKRRHDDMRVEADAEIRALMAQKVG